jgi:hypothetical protein
MVNLEVPHFSTAAPLSATRRTFQPPFTRQNYSQIKYLQAGSLPVELKPHFRNHLRENLKT